MPIDVYAVDLNTRHNFQNGNHVRRYIRIDRVAHKSREPCFCIKNSSTYVEHASSGKFIADGGVLYAERNAGFYSIGQRIRSTLTGYSCTDMYLQSRNWRFGCDRFLILVF